MRVGLFSPSFVLASRGVGRGIERSGVRWIGKLFFVVFRFVSLIEQQPAAVAEKRSLSGEVGRRPWMFTFVGC